MKDILIFSEAQKYLSISHWLAGWPRFNEVWMEIVGKGRKILTILSPLLPTFMILPGNFTPTNDDGEGAETSPSSQIPDYFLNAPLVFTRDLPHVVLFECFSGETEEWKIRKGKILLPSLTYCPHDADSTVSSEAALEEERRRGRS